MNENPYDKVLDDLILRPYMHFYNIMSEKFKDEQAKQSAIATCMIRYSNLYDKNPNFNNLIKKLSEESTNTEDNSKANVFAHFDVLLRSLPVNTAKKTEDFIGVKLKEGVKDIKKMESLVTDYLHRNGYQYEYVCSLRVADADDTPKEE